MVEGRELHFRLVGLNNQNFLMEDLETGSWWQQVTGVALQGPLAGQRLEPMPFDIVSFAIWRSEHPDTVVLAVEQDHLENYAGEDWVESVREIPVNEALVPEGELGPRELVVGLRHEDRARAYPLDVLVEQTPISDWVGPQPILVSVAADGRSVRAFERRLDGEVLELYGKPDVDPPMFLDAATGSEFDFRGIGVSGPHEGRQLPKLTPITEFWFDWHGYHPHTEIYRGGSLPGR